MNCTRFEASVRFKSAQVTEDPQWARIHRPWRRMDTDAGRICPVV